MPSYPRVCVTETRLSSKESKKKKKVVTGSSATMGVAISYFNLKAEKLQGAVGEWQAHLGSVCGSSDAL